MRKRMIFVPPTIHAAALGHDSHHDPEDEDQLMPVAVDNAARNEWPLDNSDDHRELTPELDNGEDNLVRPLCLYRVLSR